MTRMETYLETESSAPAGAPAGVMLEYFTQQAWVMQETTLQRLIEIVERHYAGTRLTETEIQAVTQGRSTKERDYQFDRATGTAILPVEGLIAKHARMVNGSSQPRGTSIETLRSQLADAREDRQVERILLAIESPGGYIAGLADFAAEVYETSFAKPVVAFADDLAASAAYWIGSQANAFYANQTAVVGSIGVYWLMIDSSARAKEMGLKIHIIRTGKNKGVGAPGVAISKENLAALQTNAESEYEIFLAAILRGRAENGLDTESLRELADGREFIGAEAVAAKLIDGITTRREILAMEWPEPRVLADGGLADGGWADTGTQAKKFDSGKESIMADEKNQETLTAEQQETVRKQAADSERARITAIQSSLSEPCLQEVQTKAIAEGWSLEKAEALALPILRAAAAEREKTLQAEAMEKQQRLDAIAAGGSDVEASEAVDADEEAVAGGQSGGNDSDDAQKYATRVQQLQTEGKSAAAAYRQAAIELPISHKAWQQKKPSNMS
jgi:signal peptide peptidase SppA